MLRPWHQPWSVVGGLGPSRVSVVGPLFPVWLPGHAGCQQSCEPQTGLQNAKVRVMVSDQF